MANLSSTWRYPTEICFGTGRIAELAEACHAVNMRKPLLVTDPGLAKHAIVQNALQANAEASVPTGLFSDIQGNPTDVNLAAGCAAFRSGSYDGVIAFGGGSALDVGKSIALLAHQGDNVWMYDGRWGAITDGIAPIIAVPTTAGTGSEVGRATVITQQATHTKKILLHAAMMPQLVIADPALTQSLPPHLTAFTGMDALAHNLEALCGTFYHPMADGIALEAMRLIHDWLPEAVSNGDNLEARAHMMAAATMGAAAFQKALGAIHAISHPIGARYNTHHGLTNAVVMPYVLIYNRSAIGEKMIHLARYLDLPNYTFDAVLDWILTLRESLSVPHTLADLGVDEATLDWIAQEALKDPNTPENPVPMTLDTYTQLIRQAWEGQF